MNRTRFALFDQHSAVFYSTQNEWKSFIRGIRRRFFVSVRRISFRSLRRSFYSSSKSAKAGYQKLSFLSELPLCAFSLFCCWTFFILEIWAAARQIMQTCQRKHTLCHWPDDSLQQHGTTIQNFTCLWLGSDSWLHFGSGSWLVKYRYSRSSKANKSLLCSGRF